MDYQIQQQYDLEKINNEKLIIVVKLLLVLLDIQYTSEELAKLYLNDQETLENIFVRVRNNHKQKTQKMISQSNDQVNKLEQEIQQLQERNNDLYLKYQQLQKKNSDDFNESRRNVEESKSLIAELRKDNVKLTQQLVEFYSRMYELQDQVNDSIKILPNQEQLHQDIQKSFVDIKKQNEEIQKLVKLFHKDEQDIEDYEQTACLIIQKLKATGEKFRKLIEIVEKKRLLFFQKDLQMEKELKKQIDIVVQSEKIFQEFEKIIIQTINNYKTLKQSHKNSIDLLNKMNNQQKLQQEETKNIQKYSQCFQGTQSSNKEIIIVELHQYFRLYRDFSEFFIKAIRQIPYFKISREFDVSQILSALQFKQGFADMQQFTNSINKFQEILKSFAQTVTQLNDLTDMLYNAITFLENLNKISHSYNQQNKNTNPNPIEIQRNIENT